MRSSILAAAAAFALGVNAANHHAHDAFHKRAARHVAQPEESCGCTTIWETITGPGSLHNPPQTKTTTTTEEAPPTSIVVPTTSSIVVPPPVIPSTSEDPVIPTTSEEPVVVTVPVVPLPTPTVTTLQPGTHTIPATTITVTEETTVCVATTTSVPSGTHTYGGVTTVVVTATTIVCPIATVTTENGVITSTIVETTYVCPTAGTYTIAPSTTTVTKSTVFVYPTPTSIVPGTYTQPEITTTIVETDYVVYCPYTSSSAPELPVPTSTSPAQVIVETPIAAPEPKPTPNGVQLGTNTDQWAITYTPYDNEGQCKDAAAVLVDISDIAAKGFTTVRLYSADRTDCNGLENVSSACEVYKLTMIVGVYINGSGIEGARPQITDLATFTRWHLVVLVVIGNESIFNGVCSAPELANFIRTSKEVFISAGYTGPVTTTETLDVLEQHMDVLCPVIDVVGANIHAFFNSGVTASEAGSFVKSQLDIVESLCPGKSGINLETGWPSAGICNGAACPGPDAQAIAIADIREKIGGKSVMFSYKNDGWKNPGQFECERSWGISTLY